MPSLAVAVDGESENDTLLRRLRAKGHLYHERVPLLKQLPFSAIAIIGLLICVNLAVWAAVGVVLVSSPPQSSVSETVC